MKMNEIVLHNKTIITIFNGLFKEIKGLSFIRILLEYYEIIRIKNIRIKETSVYESLRLCCTISTFMARLLDLLLET